MIQSTNSLNDHQLLEAKALIATCQKYDGTFRDPYLSNMLNFDPNMPAFFLYYEKGEPVGLLTVYADDPDVELAILVHLITVGRELRVHCIEVLRKKRHLIQLSL
ncbi:hypothetical protein [Streptococcus lactarius]|uniref:hypothetical protein n=1 Tax=Streptococcus lactarius TaxID=684066 RepID=UPI00361A958E